MKYLRSSLFLSLIMLLMISCSNDDSNDESSKELSNTTINPPSWIQGTWVHADISFGFTFIENDFCLSNASSLNCFGEVIIKTIESGMEVVVKEEITDSFYSIQITSLGQTNRYDFGRISNTRIELINDPLGDFFRTFYDKVDRITNDSIRSPGN